MRGSSNRVKAVAPGQGEGSSNRAGEGRTLDPDQPPLEDIHCCLPFPPPPAPTHRPTRTDSQPPPLPPPSRPHPYPCSRPGSPHTPARPPLLGFTVPPLIHAPGPAPPPPLARVYCTPSGRFSSTACLNPSNVTLFASHVLHAWILAMSLYSVQHLLCCIVLCL